MSDTIRNDCLTRAGWYVDRIDDLIRFMQERPRLDSDDVQQCQAMLREILARFRFDRRVPAPGCVQSMLERTYVWTISEAADRLRVTAASRPSVRWRDELMHCRERISDYFDQLALS